MEKHFTVYIVDDDEELRASLSWLINDEGYNTCTMGSADEFLNKHDSNAAACILLDVRMAIYNGLELQEHLNSIGSLLPIIFMTGYGDVSQAVRAIKNRAVDFLCKPFAAEVLFNAIKEAQSIYDRNHKIELKKTFIQTQISNLSKREKDVLNCVLLGYSNKLAAKKLAISVKTIEFSRANLKKKFKVKSISELVKLNLFDSL